MIKVLHYMLKVSLELANVPHGRVKSLDMINIFQDMVNASMDMVTVLRYDTSQPGHDHIPQLHVKRLQGMVNVPQYMVKCFWTW
jgi:hypothetical protein